MLVSILACYALALNLKLNEQSKQDRKCSNKHAFELREAVEHPAEQLPT